MDGPEKPLYRVVGGSGTYVDPHRLTSDLEDILHHTHITGKQAPGNIARARELLAETAVPDDVRRQYEVRITDLEYKWHLHRPADLVRLALQNHKPVRTAAKKREEWLQAAREARDAFYAFVAAHPEAHQKWGGDVPAIEVLIERRQALRSGE